MTERRGRKSLAHSDAKRESFIVRLTSIHVSPPCRAVEKFLNPVRFHSHRWVLQSRGKMQFQGWDGGRLSVSVSVSVSLCLSISVFLCLSLCAGLFSALQWFKIEDQSSALRVKRPQPFLVSEGFVPPASTPQKLRDRAMATTKPQNQMSRQPEADQHEVLRDNFLPFPCWMLTTTTHGGEGKVTIQERKLGGGGSLRR